MNLEEYIILQDRVRALRDSMSAKLAVQAGGLRDALLSEFLRSVRRGGELTVAELRELARASFRITPSLADGLEDALRRGMVDVAKAREDVFGKAGIRADVSYEELMAAHRVDLPQISAEARRQAVNAWRKTVATGGSFKDYERVLRESGIVESQAQVQADSALQQFDNDYQTTFASEGGVDVFKYTGPKPGREFCVERFNKNYSLREINAMDNGHGLPVRTSCGGWNCRHNWTPNPFVNR